jgi:hypothetical protein
LELPRDYQLVHRYHRHVTVVRPRAKLEWRQFHQVLGPGRTRAGWRRERVVTGLRRHLKRKTFWCDVPSVGRGQVFTVYNRVTRVYQTFPRLWRSSRRRFVDFVIFKMTRSMRVRALGEAKRIFNQTAGWLEVALLVLIVVALVFPASVGVPARGMEQSMIVRKGKLVGWIREICYRRFVFPLQQAEPLSPVGQWLSFAFLFAY